MPKFSRYLGVAAMIALAAAAPSSAQELTAGTWTGTMSPPGGEPIPVEFQVSGAGAALTVVMTAAMVQDGIPFNDIRVEGPALTFWWEPGVRVDCTLTRDAAGGYAGSCSDGSGSASGGMTMVPPPGQ
jgi:hypothetical protein